MNKPTQAEAIERAAEAHSDLTAFSIIMAVCESGAFHSPSYAAASQIVEICKAEVQKRLREYDRFVAVATEKAAP